MLLEPAVTNQEKEILCQTLDDNLAKGFIKHGTSSYVSPIFFIPKKDSKELRMVIDYQKLNAITKKDFLLCPEAYPAIAVRGLSG